MDNLRTKFSGHPGTHTQLKESLGKLFEHLDSLGVSNFILTDSKYLFVYCSTKICWITRRAPFGKAKLIDEDMTIDFQKETSPKDIVTIVATQPLTNNENWHILKPKDFIVFKEGRKLHG